MRTFTTNEIQEAAVRIVRATLDPDAISVLSQVRQTVEADELLVSILEHGQQVPGVAAVLLPDQVQRYLDVINSIHRVQHTVDELVPITLDGERCYFILIAGHRRLAACRQINALVRAGECAFTDRFDGRFRVELRFGMNVKGAIALQFNENRHVQVPPHEEARAAWRYWMWLSQSDPKLTTAQFGKIIGRSPDWVRRAMRFCHLPNSIQGYVDGTHGKPTIAYGILVELARLGEEYETITGESMSERVYEGWLRRALLSRMKVGKFTQMVSSYIEFKRAEVRGQLDLFGEVKQQEQTRPSRRVVAPQMIRDLWFWITYMKTVMRLCQTNAFGLEGSDIVGLETDPLVRESYSPGSPMRLLSEVGIVYRALVPALIEIAADEGGRYRRALVGGEAIVNEVAELLTVLSKYESELGKTIN